MGQSVVPVDFPLNHSSFEVHTVHTDRELEGKSWRCGREYFYTYLSLCTSHPIPLYFHILYQTCFFFSSNPRSSLSLCILSLSLLLVSTRADTGHVLHMVPGRISAGAIRCSSMRSVSWHRDLRAALGVGLVLLTARVAFTGWQAVRIGRGDDIQ